MALFMNFWGFDISGLQIRGAKFAESPNIRAIGYYGLCIHNTVLAA